MTATIELDDLMVSKAKKLTGISDDKELVNMTIARVVKGQELVRAMIEDSKVIKGNPFWDDYDPRA
jgi:Arc/MetJ family transcription regulator